MILTHGANSSLKGFLCDIGGTKYRCVEIDGQIWMAENLDWMFANGLQAKYYDNDSATYGRHGLKYGLLYSMSDFAALKNSISSLAPGWEVPTVDDLTYLSNFVINAWNMPSSLKSRTGWNQLFGNGDNLSGFSAVPSGKYGSNDGFTGLGNQSCIWLSSQDTDQPYVKIDNGISTYTGNYNLYLAIRLVKNL